MVFITAEVYKNAEVHTITVKNKDYFWVKMKDIQDGLGIKNMSDRIRQKMCGNFETKKLTKEQKRQHKRKASE